MAINIIVIALLVNSIYAESLPEIDPSGYIAYCPCMGRFGNQIDHFLGSFAFAKALNRTLIVPPFVEYEVGKPSSQQIPFTKYFEFEPLLNFHRAIRMEDFMEHYAKEVWPENKRTSFCYIERQSLSKKNTKKDCYAKDGNPFGPFWDKFKVSFVASEFYSPLHFDIHHSHIAFDWQNQYSPDEWPVLAFTGAPASFPVQEENKDLQRYLVFAKYYRDRAKDFIKNNLPKGAFVAIHLRNGIDWVRACQHVKDSKQLFASPQCLGYNNEKGELHEELCMQSIDTITRQLRRLIKTVKHAYKNNEIKSIFVSSDNEYYIKNLSASFHRQNVTVYRTDGKSPHLDLAIMTMANHFIGNCISSFSAFVKRARDISGFPSYFWAYPKERRNSRNEYTLYDEKPSKSNYDHEEL